MDSLYLEKQTIEEAEQLYDAYMVVDFPPEELKPFINIANMWRSGNYETLAAKREGELLAYLFFVKIGQRLLLDYYAVMEAHRGLGYGSEVLRRAVDYYSSYELILIETEDVAYADEYHREERLRRDAFYARNGALKVPVKGDIFDARYQLWQLPIQGQISALEFYETYVDFYQIMIPDPALQHRVKIFLEEDSAI